MTTRKAIFSSDMGNVVLTRDQPNRKKRVNIKSLSTLSLGSASIKHSLHLARKTKRVFGVELGELMKRERRALGDQGVDHTVPLVVSQLTSFLCDEGICIFGGILVGCSIHEFG